MDKESVLLTEEELKKWPPYFPKSEVGQVRHSQSYGYQGTVDGMMWVKCDEWFWRNSVGSARYLNPIDECWYQSHSMYRMPDHIQEHYKDVIAVEMAKDGRQTVFPEFLNPFIEPPAPKKSVGWFGRLKDAFTGGASSSPTDSGDILYRRSSPNQGSKGDPPSQSGRPSQSEEEPRPRGGSGDDKKKKKKKHRRHHEKTKKKRSPQTTNQDTPDEAEDDQSPDHSPTHVGLLLTPSTGLQVTNPEPVPADTRLSNMTAFGPPNTTFNPAPFERTAPRPNPQPAGEFDSMHHRLDGPFNEAPEYEPEDSLAGSDDTEVSCTHCHRRGNLLKNSDLCITCYDLGLSASPCHPPRQEEAAQETPREMGGQLTEEDRQVEPSSPRESSYDNINLVLDLYNYHNEVPAAAAEAEDGNGSRLRILNRANQYGHKQDSDSDGGANYEEARKDGVSFDAIQQYRNPTEGLQRSNRSGRRLDDDARDRSAYDQLQSRASPVDEAARLQRSRQVGHRPDEDARYRAASKHTMGGERIRSNTFDKIEHKIDKEKRFKEEVLQAVEAGEKMRKEWEKPRAVKKRQKQQKQQQQQQQQAQADEKKEKSSSHGGWLGKLAAKGKELAKGSSSSSKKAKESGLTMHAGFRRQENGQLTNVMLLHHHIATDDEDSADEGPTTVTNRAASKPAPTSWQHQQQQQRQQQQQQHLQQYQQQQYQQQQYQQPQYQQEQQQQYQQLQARPLPPLPPHPAHPAPPAPVPTNDPRFSFTSIYSQQPWARQTARGGEFERPSNPNPLSDRNIDAEIAANYAPDYDGHGHGGGDIQTPVIALPPGRRTWAAARDAEFGRERKQHARRQQQERLVVVREEEGGEGESQAANPLEAANPTTGGYEWGRGWRDSIT